MSSVKYCSWRETMIDGGQDAELEPCNCRSAASVSRVSPGRFLGPWRRRRHRNAARRADPSRLHYRSEASIDFDVRSVDDLVSLVGRVYADDLGNEAWRAPPSHAADDTRQRVVAWIGGVAARGALVSDRAADHQRTPRRTLSTNEEAFRVSWQSPTHTQLLTQPAKLLERHQQSHNCLGVLDPAIPDHFESVIAVDVDDLDELAFVEPLFPGR